MTNDPCHGWFWDGELGHLTVELLKGIPFSQFFWRNVQARMFMQTEEEAERLGLPKSSCLVGSGEWWSKNRYLSLLLFLLYIIPLYHYWCTIIIMIPMESMALSENGGTPEILCIKKVYDSLRPFSQLNPRFLVNATMFRLSQGKNPFQSQGRSSTSSSNSSKFQANHFDGFSS